MPPSTIAERPLAEQNSSDTGEQSSDDVDAGYGLADIHTQHLGGSRVFGDAANPAPQL
jgi:hypothetical protein